MFKKLTYTFGSKSKAQEIIYLIHNAKEVVRQGFYPQELEKIERFCENNHLHLAKSKFKVIASNEEIGNYSNKGFRIPENDKREGMFFVYISKDEEKAWLASYYELVGNDKALGKLLGFPECCINFFKKNFNEIRTNPELKPTNPFTNISQREKDNVLISHFPCSSDCEKSIQIGKKHLELINKIDQQRAKELYESLQC